MGWMFLCSSLYMLWIAFSMETRNMRSTLVFKLIPFLIGVFNGYHASLLFDILK